MRSRRATWIPKSRAAAVQFLRENAPRVYQTLLERFDVNNERATLDATETAADVWRRSVQAAAGPPSPAPVLRRRPARGRRR